MAAISLSFFYRSILRAIRLVFFLCSSNVLYVLRMKCIQVHTIIPAKNVSYTGSHKKTPIFTGRIRKWARLIADLDDGEFPMEQCRQGLIVETTPRVFRDLASRNSESFVHHVTFGECSQAFIHICWATRGWISLKGS